MSTLLDIKTEAASILAIAPANLTINGQDLFLQAVNSARRSAELNYDLEFTRKTVYVTVNGATGGDLLDAVDADGNAVRVKTVIEAGLSDSSGNFSPVTWTTTAESMERQRQDNRGFTPRRPDGSWYERGRSGGLSRFTFSGTKVNLYPKATDTNDTNFNLGMEVYSLSQDWTKLLPEVFVQNADFSTVNGPYKPQGMWNSHILYMKTSVDGAYFLYWDSDSWHITQASNLGSGSADAYNGPITESQSPVSETQYEGAGAYAGNALVIPGDAADSISDVWTNQGYSYLLWASIVHLNHRFKTFVPRTEGNLPPPIDMMQGGLTSLIEWDTAMFEQFRRHSR